jgi:hypothetical protein
VPGKEPAREKNHGRYQARSVKALNAPTQFNLAGAAQVFRIIRRTKTMEPGARWTVETAYGATSLAWDQAGPEDIADRGARPCLPVVAMQERTVVTFHV